MREMKDSGVEWIGEIPQNWTCLKLKHVIESCDGGIWGKDPTNTTLDKIVIRSTEQSVDGKWYISNPATRDLSGIKNLQRFRIQVGDLLMTKSSGSALHIGKTTLADEYFVENECYYSNFLQRIRLIINPQFAWYILNSSISREQFVYLQNSTSGIGNINAENISNIYIPVPNRDAQKMISDFLNAKCIKTDTLIQNVQTQIEKLKAYKQSLITEVVTKGLDPTVPMKDSGVDWIGEIAENFQIMRLKNIAYILDQYRKPITADMRSQEGDVLYDYYGASGAIDKIDGYTIDDHVMLIGEDGANLRMRNLPLMYEVKGKAWINNHAHILKPKENVLFYYLFYALEGLDINPYITGSAQPKLSQEKLKIISVPIPAIGVQELVIEYIQDKHRRIDRLIAIKQAKIEKLEQYKRSLIYEYVTGKKEVI